jgi:hypothetical protein
VCLKISIVQYGIIAASTQQLFSKNKYLHDIICDHGDDHLVIFETLVDNLYTYWFPVKIPLVVYVVIKWRRYRKNTLLYRIIQLSEETNIYAKTHVKNVGCMSISVEYELQGKWKEINKVLNFFI